MSELKVGGYATLINDEDVRNIGKVVSLFRHHDYHMGHKDVWLFDCNDGIYINGVLKFTNIGTEAFNLEVNYEVI